MQRERAREREAGSTLLTTLPFYGGEEGRLLQSLSQGQGRKGLWTESPKWHQILDLGTEIQGESFKGSPAFHPGRSKTSNTLASTTQDFLDQVNLIRAKNRITVITNLKKKDLLHLRKVKIIIRIITNCSRESEWVNMDLWQILLGEKQFCVTNFFPLQKWGSER